MDFGELGSPDWGERETRRDEQLAVGRGDGWEGEEGDEVGPSCKWRKQHGTKRVSFECCDSRGRKFLGRWAVTGLQQSVTYQEGKSILKVPQLVIGIKNVLEPQNQICGALNYTKRVTRDPSVVLTPILVYVTTESAWTPHVSWPRHHPLSSSPFLLSLSLSHTLLVWVGSWGGCRRAVAFNGARWDEGVGGRRRATRRRRLATGDAPPLQRPQERRWAAVEGGGRQARGAGRPAMTSSPAARGSKASAATRRFLAAASSTRSLSSSSPSGMEGRHGGGKPVASSGLISDSKFPCANIRSGWLRRSGCMIRKKERVAASVVVCGEGEQRAA
nr:uncharacterized protein LOC112936673 isoform X2 [Oryza sativa Japonica Group]